MVGRRAGAAAARGRAGSGVSKRETAGNRRKAQDVLCTEHGGDGNTTPRQAAAQSQSQQTMKSVRASFQQEVSSAGRQLLPLLLQVPAFLKKIALKVVCNDRHCRQATLKPRFRNRALLSWLVSQLWSTI